MNDTVRMLVLGLALCFSGCGESTTVEDDDTTAEPAPADVGGETVEDEPPPEGLPGSDHAERPSMTAEECEAQGGELVGDIGNGAIHRPDYTCPGGQPPIATVPLGIEGSVCCMP